MTGIFPKFHDITPPEVDDNFEVDAAVDITMPVTPPKTRDYDMTQSRNYFKILQEESAKDNAKKEGRKGEDLSVKEFLKDDIISSATVGTPQPQIKSDDKSGHVSEEKSLQDDVTSSATVGTPQHQIQPQIKSDDKNGHVSRQKLSFEGDVVSDPIPLKDKNSSATNGKSRVNMSTPIRTGSTLTQHASATNEKFDEINISNSPRPMSGATHSKSSVNTSTPIRTGSTLTQHASATNEKFDEINTSSNSSRPTTSTGNGDISKKQPSHTKVNSGDTASNQLPKSTTEELTSSNNDNETLHNNSALKYSMFERACIHGSGITPLMMPVVGFVASFSFLISLNFVGYIDDTKGIISTIFEGNLHNSTGHIIGAMTFVIFCISAIAIAVLLALNIKFRSKLDSLAKKSSEIETQSWEESVNTLRSLKSEIYELRSDKKDLHFFKANIISHLEIFVNNVLELYEGLSTEDNNSKYIGSCGLGFAPIKEEPTLKKLTGVINIVLDKYSSVNEGQLNEIKAHCKTFRNCSKKSVEAVLDSRTFDSKFTREKATQLKGLLSNIKSSLSNIESYFRPEKDLSTIKSNCSSSAQPSLPMNPTTSLESANAADITTSKSRAMFR